MSNTYFTIEKPSVAEFKDRGSKFIAYAFPIQAVEDFKKRLKELKEEHPKAAHHCFAYRLGTDGNNFRASDDGEPAGSSGRPILGSIDSKSVTNCAVVVVRYFGGTLLGVPGLINAYKTAAAEALQFTSIIEKPVVERFTVSFDYTIQNEVMRIVKQNKGTIVNLNQQLFCTLTFEVPKENKDSVLQQLTDLRNLEILPPQ